jgi:hypothetical protein
MHTDTIGQYLIRPDKKQCVDCGISLVLVFLAMGLYTGRKTFFLIAFVIQLIIVLWPLLLRPPAVVWFGILKITGELMSAVLLGLVFFVVVVPVGMIRKWMGKDRLILRDFKKNRSTVFTERRHVYKSADLDHPF